MMSLCSPPLSLAVHSSHLRTSHLPARARSTGLPSPRILRVRSRSAFHPVLSAPRLLLGPTSSSNGRKICVSNGELPLGGGGSGGGGSSSGKPRSGDEDDRSGEGFRILNRILKLLRRLLQLGVSKETLLAGDFLAAMHSWISISSEEMQSLSSSHSSDSTHEIILMGDEESHCDGSSNDKLKVIMPPQDNLSERSSRTSSNINIYSTRTTEMRTRTTNSQHHGVDTDISDDGTLLDETKKKMKAQSRKKKKQMEGRRGYGFNIANSSCIWALGLLPYWGLCCSDPTLSISKTWKDALYIGYIFLVHITVIVLAQFSRYKDGKLPVNAGFKLLERVQLPVVLCLCVATFIPQRVCRGVSNWAIWPSTAGALFFIMTTWGTNFPNKTVMKCIKAPCQMVIKCINVMYEKVRQLLPYPSLPECIKAKFKKMPKEQSYPGVPMESV